MYEYAALVTAVHDGDTFKADVDLGFRVWARGQVFRMDGINAPELTSQDPAVKARAIAAHFALANLILGHTVTVRTRKDKREKYGRMLVQVSVPTLSITVNAWLIEAGYAVFYDGTGKVATPAPVKVPCAKA